MDAYQVFRDSSEFSSIASGYSKGHTINIQSQTQSVQVPLLNLPKPNTFDMQHPNTSDTSHSRNPQKPPLLSSSSLDSNPCTPMLGSSRRLSTAAYDPTNTTPGINNFESTQDLRSFVVTVDLQKINRDRQNQLKLALEDNLREKEQGVAEALKALSQQRHEYEGVSRQLEARISELENEMVRQKQHISGLKQQASQIEKESQEIDEKQVRLEKSYQGRMAEVVDSIQCKEREAKGMESEMQIMRYERQTTEQTIEIRKRVRMQELDEKIKPLIEEKEQMELSRDLMINNLQILQDVKQQNENEKTMIEEDLWGSGQTKMELIYQREEIEQYIEKTKCDNSDLQFISGLNISQTLTSYWDQALQQLLQEKQRSLLLDLIRELHQYILGMSSNTTDNSVMQSDELEELQFMIEKKTVMITDAVDLIANFAQNKIKIDLTAEVLQNKLNHVSDQLDEQQLRESLEENEQLESQMRGIDNRIKVITNRSQNELQPRLKALSLSEVQMNEEIAKVESSLQEINETLAILINEISDVKDDFERTQQSMMPKEELVEDEKLEVKLDNLSQQITFLDMEIKSMRKELEDLKINKEQLAANYQEKTNGYEQRRFELDKRYQEVLEAIKNEKNHVLHYEVTNPKIQELTKIVTQLKCDKESAHKRLKYIEARLANSQESVAHARQVLDTHILQIQQEQLHQKINQNGSTAVQFNRRKQSAVHQSSIDPLDNKANKIEVARPPLQDLTNVQNHRKQEPDNPIGIPSFDSYGSRTQQKHLQEKEENRRLHMQLIDPDDNDNVSKIGLKDNGNSKKTLNHRDAIYAMLRQDKSAADLVKYNYESSAGISNLEEQSQIASSNRQQAINLVALAKSKNIPIQTLITPREHIQEMMQYNHSHQASIVSQPTHYELGLCNQFMHNASIGSTDSLCPPTSNKKSQAFLSRQLSVQLNDSPSLKNFHQTMQHSSSVYQQTYTHNLVPSIKISLRESHTRSIDDARSSLSSSINNFKENVAPNIAISAAASSTLNMRKLSQATILSSTSSQVMSKPPAVPQGKVMGLSNDEQSKMRQSGVIQKNAKVYQNAQYMEQQPSSQFNSNRYQTKMRLCQNSNNGKILAVGIVDLSRCNQTMVQRDIQFFESVKPLIEGAQFLFFSKHGQCQAKHIFLDFSLLRLFITATSSSSLNADRREILMIENIVKPELPQSTLDLIKQEKHGSGLGDSQHSSSVSSSSRRYEFHLIINNINGMAEKMHLMTKSYEDLRLWIIGLNALIANKNNLMRLSTMIKS